MGATALAVLVPAVLAALQTGAFTAYDDDPAHPWNRLHRALFAREVDDGSEIGAELLDPLLWSGSTWLGEPARRAELLDALDDVLAEPPPSDALRRAALQRDLWVVFDWLAVHDAGDASEGADAGHAAATLLDRLAAAMRHLALAPKEVAALPDMLQGSTAAGRYPPSAAPRGEADGPFLPPDLLDAGGEWVAVGAHDGGVLAPIHVRETDGRSVFTVHLQLPGGRAATLEWLAALDGLAEPRVPGPQGEPVLSPALPQFPAGTQVALLRRALHVDRDGALAATPLVESLQIRVHDHIPAVPEPDAAGQRLGRAMPEEIHEEQRFLEFELDRRGLFAGAHDGLRARTDDVPFTTFLTHGEPVGADGRLRAPAPAGGVPRSGQPSSPAGLQRCAQCHGHPGVYALNSFTTLTTGPGTAFLVPVRNGPRRLESQTPSREEEITRRWKRERPSWAALQSRWRR